jgi:hypothetical protein
MSLNIFNFIDDSDTITAELVTSYDQQEFHSCQQEYQQLYHQTYQEQQQSYQNFYQQQQQSYQNFCQQQQDQQLYQQLQMHQQQEQQQQNDNNYEDADEDEDEDDEEEMDALGSISVGIQYQNFNPDLSQYAQQQTLTNNSQFNIMHTISLGCDTTYEKNDQVRNQDQQSKIVKTNRNKTLDSTVKCQICLKTGHLSDKKIIFAYNAVICEACKKFFHRALTESTKKSISLAQALETYQCNNNFKCPITPSQRSCKRCRLQKCLIIEMNNGI